MKKYILTILLALLFVPFAFSQSFTKWELEWNISMPSGDFNDWIDETGLRGIEFGGTYEFETGVTAGASIGYAAFFRETERKTVEFGTNAITAKQFRDLFSYYFLAEGGYAFLPDSPVRPYAKVGLGVYYTEQALQIGLLYFEDDTWDFGLRPEVGVQYFNEDASIGATVNGKYNYVVDYGNDLDNFSYIAVGVGIIMRF